MNTNNYDFDKEAAKWDAVPARVKLGLDIAMAMQKLVGPGPDMDLLDFGCGTGLISFFFQPLVASVTGVDSSQGMLNVFESKAAEKELANVSSQLVNIEKGDLIKGSYDVVVSSMALHHIKDVQSVLTQFYKVLKPGGILCVADLDPDDGKFHPEDMGFVYNGFDRSELSNTIRETGFKNVKAVDATEINKCCSDDITRNFSVFAISARK